MTEPHHILLVEDELALGSIVKYNLEAEGYRVTHVGDGPTALAIYGGERPVDLIILDLMLPGMSGYQVCESIRRHDVAIPILMLSARSLSEDRSRGFDVGTNQFLTKPADLDELLSRVRNLLRLRRTETSAASEPLSLQTPTPEIKQTQFGDAVVNFETHQVFVGGKRIKLTSKELQLLQYFVANEGRVIPRQELLRSVWDVSGDLQTRSVDQFMLRLRKTFEPDPARPRHFLTIRDAGYRFVKDGER